VVLWALTLRRRPYGENVAGFVDVVVGWLASSPLTAWITFLVVEFAANVALFAPFGMLAVLWGARAWAAIVAGLATSGAIELIQLLFLPERVADVRDLLANTLGAALGAAVLVASRRLARRKSASAA
jgi:glycopeptide antibiotics resistance protein